LIDFDTLIPASPFSMRLGFSYSPLRHAEPLPPRRHCRHFSMIIMPMITDISPPLIFRFIDDAI
jgi:hypothetical protein